MKKFSIILALIASILGGCVAYVPQPAPQGGPGNGFCPPGQAKKGNC